MSFSVDVDASMLLALREKMERLDADMVPAVDTAMELEVQAMRQMAYELAPKRTGYLASTIVAGRIREWSFQLQVLAPYARFVEYGTRFMAARRFIARTLELRMPALVNHVNRAIREAIGRMQ